MSSLADMLFRDGIQMTALQAGIELCQSCGEAPVEASGFCENCLDVLADLRHADQDEGGQR